MRSIFFYLLFFSAVYLAFNNISPSSCSANTTNSTGTIKGIRFIEEDWDKALEQARLQNKMIFLDAYASWCGPCKLMKRSTFSDKEVGEYFNEHFVNVAIDMEKGIGPSLSKKFGLEAYPTLFILDQNGNVIGQSVGFLRAGQLINFAKEHTKTK